MNAQYAADMDTEAWDSEDWADFNGHPSENNHYVSTAGTIVRRCNQCGYEGTDAHPHRNRPTLSAPVHYECPDAQCGAIMSAVGQDD
jgi:hypothetical protein